MRLTPIQVAIVKHRLEIPDAIYECLNDTYDDQFDYEDVCDAAEYLAEAIEEPIDYDALTNVERQVLKDAIEGSTYADAADDAVSNREMSYQEAAAIRRAFERLKGLI